MWYVIVQKVCLKEQVLDFHMPILYWKKDTLCTEQVPKNKTTYFRVYLVIAIIFSNSNMSLDLRLFPPFFLEVHA